MDIVSLFFSYLTKITNICCAIIAFEYPPQLIHERISLSLAERKFHRGRFLLLSNSIFLLPFDYKISIIIVDCRLDGACNIGVGYLVIGVYHRHPSPNFA